MAGASPAVPLSHKILWMGTGVIVIATIVLIAIGSPIGLVLLLNELGGAAGLASTSMRTTRPRGSRYFEISAVALMVASAIALVVVVLNLFPPASSIHIVP